MRLRFTHAAAVLVISACGRLGYDEAPGSDGRHADAALGTGSTGSRSDAGSGADGGAGGAGSSPAAGGLGSSSGGLGSFGGTDAGFASGGSGGSGVGGATPATGGSGGAIGTGGALNDGAVGTGGTLNDGAVGTGGTLDDGAVGTGGVVGVGDGGIVGCADGEREGFTDLVTYPAIAACGGGFAVAGIVALTGPVCGRAAGDDGARPDGAGCNAEDLCAVGFHLCADAAEVAGKSSTGCTGAAVGIESQFFLTAQHGAGQAKCGPAGIDDVYGCGSMGARPNIVCAPLDRWSGNRCVDLAPPWSCGAGQGEEALQVVKPGPLGGGVLCCRD